MVSFKFRPIIHSFILFVIACLAFLALYAPIIDLRVSDKEINDKVETVLPFSRKMGAADMHVTAFDLKSTDGNVAVVNLKTVTSSMGEKIVSMLTVSTRLRVMEEKIYLSQLTLDDVSLDIPGVDKQSLQYALYQGAVFAAVEAMREELHATPIVDFEAMGEPEATIGKLLHAIRFEDEIVVASLNPGKAISHHAITIFGMFSILILLSGLHLRRRSPVA